MVNKSSIKNDKAAINQIINSQQTEKKSFVTMFINV